MPVCNHCGMDAAECNYTPKKRQRVSIDGNGAVPFQPMSYESETAAFVVSDTCSQLQNLRHPYSILRRCTSWHHGQRIQLTRYRLDHRNTSPKTFTFHLIPTFPRTTVLHHVPYTKSTGDDNNNRGCQCTGLEPWIRYLSNTCPSSHGVTKTSSRSHG